MVGPAKFLLPALLTEAMSSSVSDRSVLLTGGVEMPVVALGTGGFDNATAEAAVKLALVNGLNHIHTAFDYFNQPGVGRGLAGRPRGSFFVTTMTSPCIHTASNPYRNVTDPTACQALTKKEVEMDLQHLQLGHVDLLLLHGPAQAYGTKGACQPEICDITRAQWAAYVELQKAGKARAIGVSNFCASCFECLASGTKDPIWPAVNQVQYHVGMGYDPQGLLAYSRARGIVVQAYSPLASGKIFDPPLPALTTIAKAHNKSDAQIALRWILSSPAAELALVTKASTQSYISEDVALFGWDLTKAEMATLDALSSPSSVPSWGCTE